MRDGETWCMVTPPHHTRRDQGWKLHLSATRPSSAQVLEHAARVLVAHGCAFKFAVSPRITADLNSVRAPRAQSGKFLTAYPGDDDQLRTLAELLHEATRGLTGPTILSDRRYRPDSLVHYRYGSFASTRRLNDEGLYEGRLRAPDGTFVADERNPWFSPPTWAPLPFEPPASAASGRRRGDRVLLAGRYRVEEAIRHSNRGGVYRAHDRRTGDDVLVKEARPHVGADACGRDARHWLRHEGDVLERLAPLGITPAVREVFEAAGHVFLVQDLIPGTNLARWCAERLARDGGPIPTPVAWRVARELTRLIGATHAAGLVLRDFKPGNVMMTPDDMPVLVDMECAIRFGEDAPVVGTHGFTAPEYLDHGDAKPAPAPGPEVDCYSLGATLLHVACGIIPQLAADSPAHRGAGERIGALVDTAVPTSPALRALAPLVLGLTADLPSRWTIEEAAAFLRREPGASASVTAGPALTHDALQRLIRDGLAHLAATINPVDEHLWPRPRSAPPGDPCSVQLGAAGVLSVLDRAVRHGEHTAGPTLRTTARWLDERLAEPDRILPGLYFGRSGTVWALHDAALTLRDDELADSARRYALRIPLDGTNPDICHGLAGAGLAQLHLWHTTSDPRFAERASHCADQLLHLTSGVAARAAHHQSGPFGSAPYGFGHGTAGNAAFLLAAGRALDRPDLVDVATRAGHALCAVARTNDDAADWPKEPGQTERTDLNFWCHGASGIGTFLIRLWRATGERRFREYAERAAHAAYRDRARLGPSTCHGTAGNAELLLDVADATGEDRYREWAAQIAACLHARTTLRDGRLLVPDDTLREVSAAYNVGLAGVLDFLLRLKHGGNRSWLVDIA
ncbi:class IV lanthionine synthetase LanL [Streptomyces sp. NPDC101151]|uniref:class IV lanthionine synthetase LanL n=1 Tax=Streptomyces sp. NPDC101151 TaxID=3366115 RepID=UPI003800BD17